MYCEKCGKAINKGAKFCAGCGAAVKPPEETAAEITDSFKKRRYEKIPDKIKMLENEAEYRTFIAKAKGDYAFINGNYKEASDAYAQIPADRREWDATLNLALVCLNESKPMDAISLLESIKQENIRVEESLLYSERYKSGEKAMVDICLYLGALYKNAGNTEKALDAFKKASVFDPGSELVNANIGDMFFKEDNYEQAIGYYKLAIDSGANSFNKSSLHNDLGLAYFRKGLVEEAITSFKKAIILNPGNDNAVYNLGTIYVRSGMQDKVKEDYKEFLSREGGVDIVFNLSRSIMNAAKHEVISDANIGFIGEGEAIKKAKEIIVKAAATDSTVFLQGENGTGKELAARAIHQLSRRSDRPFIVVNCGALPETLLESELFGYEKGAFTGAVKDKQGRFELADKGTVFLDEIGDITQPMQVKLLRFVQQREFERVGGTLTKKVDIRIITATNKDIKKLVGLGKFREDLYYRLYVLPLVMPPLRARGADIKLLAEYFLKVFATKYEKTFSKISEEALLIFNSYSWPGNVRQLENVIERVVTLFDDTEIRASHLPEEMTGTGDAMPGAESEPDEKTRILNVLKEAKYSKTNAAKALGISRVALWKKLKKLGIS